MQFVSQQKLSVPLLLLPCVISISLNCMQIFLCVSPLPLSLPVSLSLSISICILPINFVAVVATLYGRAGFGDFMSS